jgi:16S rRNA processing protein RimM
LDWQDQAKGPVAALEGYSDPESARELSRLEILVDKAVLPSLEAGDYYWHQLEGLRVLSDYQGQRYEFGIVKSMLETGANDVLVVQGEGQRERLIPYLPERVVKKVDLEAGTLTVEWDPEF